MRAEKEETWEDGVCVQYQSETSKTFCFSVCFLDNLSLLLRKQTPGLKAHLELAFPKTVIYTCSYLMIPADNLITWQIQLSTILNIYNIYKKTTTFLDKLPLFC